MNSKIFIVSILSLFLSGYGFAQPNSRNKTAEISIDPVELGKKLDSVFAPTNKNSSPGCAVTVLADGKIVAKKIYGMASIEHHVPFTHQSVLRMPYSEAREFISVAAVLMEKDGLLNLNDKVIKYFPRLPEWSAQVSLWDLLNHRSGFVDEWATFLLMYNSMSNRFETAQFLNLLYTQPTPQIEPGKGYMYCNSDFGLLRLIMEKACGKNLPDWMKERIFTPLQMVKSSMQKNPLDIIPDRAEMYDEQSGDIYQHAQVQKTSPGGNYHILSSADDLEYWYAAIADPASEIGQASAKLIANVRRIPGMENHYVVGYSSRKINNQEVILHEGVNGYNYMTRIPQLGVAVITFGNRNGNGFANENKAIINYLLKMPAPQLPKLLTTPVSIPEKNLTKYVGNYRWLEDISWEGYRQSRKFSSFFIADGKLKVRYTGNFVIALTPVANDVFYYNDGFGIQFVFKQESANSPMHVTITYDDGFPGEKMAKDSTAVWIPTKEMLTGFKGKYHSKHLDYFWNIDLDKEGKLVLKRNTLPDAILDPDGLNQFHYIAEKYPGSGFDQWLLFNKDDKGNITGITVWSARVMHHQFDKID